MVGPLPPHLTRLSRYAKPCVPIISHRRSAQSVAELGENLLVSALHLPRVC